MNHVKKMLLMFGVGQSVFQPETIPTYKLSGLIGSGLANTGLADIPYPVVANGDLLIMHVTSNDGARVNIDPILAPAGWTEIKFWVSNLFKTSIFYKIADGTETGNVAVDAQMLFDTFGVIHSFTGHNLEQGLYENYDEFQSRLTTFDYSSPFQTLRNNVLSCVFFSQTDNQAQTVTPVGYISRSFQTTNINTDATFGLYTEDIAVSGSDDGSISHVSVNTLIDQNLVQSIQLIGI